MNGIKDKELWKGQIVEINLSYSEGKPIYKVQIEEIYKKKAPSGTVTEYNGNARILKVKILEIISIERGIRKRKNMSDYFHSWYVSKIVKQNPSIRGDKI